MVLRGAPRHIRGEAAGKHGVISLVPEVTAGPDGSTVRPSAIIAITPGGVRRYKLGAARDVPFPRLTVRGQPRFARQGDTSGAASRIVPGEDALPEDPRVSAAFGPTHQHEDTAEIPLSAVLTPDDAPVSLGAITITAGRVSISSKEPGK